MKKHAGAILHPLGCIWPCLWVFAPCGNHLVTVTRGLSVNAASVKGGLLAAVVMQRLARGKLLYVNHCCKKAMIKGTTNGQTDEAIVLN